MNSFAKLLRAILLLSLFTLPQLAASQDIPGWYIGFGIGQSKFKDACCDNTDTAGKFLGGYQFSRNFDLELAYADLGQAKAGGSTFGAKGLEFAGVGMLPIGNKFSLLARGGLFHWKVDTTAPSTSASGTDLTFGLGVKFDFNRDFSIRGEWQRYKDVGDLNKTGQTDVDFIGASLVYRL
jgi:OOP family OmpA-OmpF porin